MKTIYFILLVILVASCKTSFRISTIQPAMVRLPKEVKMLGIVNFVNSHNSPEQQLADVVLGGQQMNGNVAAAERAVDGIVLALNASRDVRGEIVPMDRALNSEGELNWDFLNAYAQERHLDGFLIMNELHSVSPIGGTVIGNVIGQSSSRLEGILHYEIRTVSNQRLEGLSCRYVHNIPLSGTTNILDILNDVARKREAYRSMGYELGRLTGNQMIPNWIWVDRDFYNKGSKALKAAKPMIRAGNWDIAEKQLLQDADHYKNKVRGRVLYNLALVKEGQGYIDEAIKYAEMAALECYNKHANDYLVKLRWRQTQLENM